MNSFSKKAVKIGTMFMLCAAISVFIPALYLWLRYGAWPGWSGLGSLASLLVPMSIVGWIVQPISYFPALGVAGTYMTWMAGSAADVRVPASAAAQNAAEVEPGSAEAEVASTLGVCTSIVVTVLVMLLFVIAGAAIVNILPPSVTAAFVYILPALVGALYTTLTLANRRVGSITLFINAILYFVLRKAGIPTAIIMLLMVISGIIITIAIFRSQNKKSLIEKE
ncbi:hypothetical protein [Lutispora saccharofermentans]|uniref:Uncharacterized protein n=1 Tax=Lutispora saccharofermentans TaxID=3024236 RepID=A0ABT1NEJ7_9FIRM|nr:hypothetical protein [Lutispora saccharofermentans]MCQ1529695.1 hypothetical protein [Lutispora saccharofermentans]